MVVAGLLWRFECLAPRGATANGASGVGLRGPNALCEGEELDFDRTVKIAAMFWPPGATNPARPLESEANGTESLAVKV